MKRQIFLTLGLILIVNGLIGLGIYLWNNSFIFVPAGTGTGSVISVQKQDKIIKQEVIQKVKISDLQNKVIEVVKKLSPSVVSIVISKDLNIYYYNDPFSLRPYVEKEKKKIGGGSGIIISKAGYILTNKHVVADMDADYSVVTKDGNIYKVDKIRTDPILDLAVIHVVKQNGEEVNNLKPAPITDLNSKNPVGEFVIAIGNALAEYSNTVTFGILSAKGRHLDNNNGSLYIGLYQTDAAINPGNSGGPLINLAGEVIGVNTAITAQGQGIGFSIPINRQFIQATLNSILTYNAIKRPMLGIMFIQLNKTLARQYSLPTYKGVLVQKVLPYSPAAKAGIKKGDIIEKIDGKTIDTDNPIIYTLFTHNLGDTVDLLINRNGKLINKKVVLTQF